MKSQRRFAPKGGRIESESVAGLAGISTRIADWELFGRKVAPKNNNELSFETIIENMNASKEIFGLEDDQLYYLLDEIVNNQKRGFKDISAGDLFVELQKEADKLKMSDFKRKYSSPISIGKRLRNLESELSRVFQFKIIHARANQKLYTIKRLDGQTVKSFEEQKGWNKNTSLTKMKDADDMPSEAGEDEVVERIQSKVDALKKKRTE